MSREIITVQVGRTGNNIAHEFWRNICDEHQIDFDKAKGRFVGDQSSGLIDNVGVFFDEGRDARFTPRAVLCDLNLADLEQVTREPLGNLYRPEMVVANDEGSGNCYAKAFHTEGPDIADRILDIVRQQVEKCNCLQGVQFVHSMGGGTGSGLSGLLLKAVNDYLDNKSIMQSVATLPSPGFSDTVLEVYNAALALQDSLEYCDQVFVHDNAALSRICRDAFSFDSPKFNQMNSIVALGMSGLTSSLRFPGLLNADLRKIHTSLVPFKNAHFLMTAFAPLSMSEYSKFSVYDLAQRMLVKESISLSCEPLNPGTGEGQVKARSLASFAAFRGDFGAAEVDEVLRDLEKHGSHFDRIFPDWIPCSISQSICSTPHPEIGNCVTYASNNTAIHEVFDRIGSDWDKMFAVKSHLHVYEKDGIHANDMLEARNVVRYLSDQYRDYARWEDKLLDNKIGADGRRLINEAAAVNDEQRKVLEELTKLQNIYINHGKEGRA